MKIDKPMPRDKNRRKNKIIEYISKQLYSSYVYDNYYVHLYYNEVLELPILISEAIKYQGTTSTKFGAYTVYPRYIDCNFLNAVWISDSYHDSKWFIKYNTVYKSYKIAQSPIVILLDIKEKLGDITCRNSFLTSKDYIDISNESDYKLDNKKLIKYSNKPDNFYNFISKFSNKI